VGSQGVSAVAAVRPGLPAAVKDASRAYQEESDVVGRFIDECCQIDESYKITKRELYAFYKEWCEKNGERHQTSKKFGGLIKKRRQFSEKRGRVDDKVVRFWEGLKLADDVFDDEGVLDFGNTTEYSDSEGSDALSEQTLPSAHVRQEEITSRGAYKKSLATLMKKRAKNTVIVRAQACCQSLKKLKTNLATRKMRLFPRRCVAKT